MPPCVLLIGGHGKVSQILTPKLLSRSWNVTSLIREPFQTATVEALGKNQSGKLSILVRSLEEVKSQQEAQAILDESRPDYVVWSAGAGGRGGPSRTYAIDRDACIHFIRASLATPTITKFLLISYLGSRRCKAPWWSSEEWEAAQHVNTSVLPDYYKAKVEADECLTALAKKKGGDLKAVVLRPGSLTDGGEMGKVSLGKTAARGKVDRGDVAEVAATLLESNYKGWVDMLEGNEEIGEAVKRVEKEGLDCVEGEDLEAMARKYD